jgi:hypothetical protein
VNWTARADPIACQVQPSGGWQVDLEKHAQNGVRMFAMHRKNMHRLRLFCAFSVLLIAADPSWRNKPIPDWTEQEAKQILVNSPWAKMVGATVLRRQTEDERREGGNMGQEHGVGYDGVDDKRRKLPSSISEVVKGTGEDTKTPTRALKLLLRWESALPVRAAELKARFVEPPTLAGEGYSIAVYGVPGTALKGDPLTLGEPLKKAALLKREGKKDVRPSSVEVFQRDDGFVVTYLFPPSAEIVAQDGRVEFSAQIGRIAFAQFFELEPMMFQGKLEI